MKQTLLLMILLCPFLAVRSQINRNGLPMVTNYTPAMMSAAEQNWAVLQDDRGVIYLGNNDDGVIEYDGKTWHKISLPNNSSVKSLARDRRGTIYVGAIGEFGYLEPDELGRMTYRSLMGKLDSSHRGFAQHVWRTFCLGDSVFFSAAEKLFIYDHDSVRVLSLPAASNFSFGINGRVFIGNYVKGLLELKGDSAVPVHGGDFFIHKNIFVLLPFVDDQLLVGTGSSGLYSFNPRTGEVGKNIIDPAVNELFKSGTLYYGVPLAGGWYAFTTLYNGAIILDENLKAVNHLTGENGLQDHTIISAYTCEDNTLASPLWLAMNEGLTRVDYHIPVRKFDELSGLKGFVMDIIRFRGVLYVATFNGVYAIREGSLPVPVLYGEDPINEAWSFARWLNPDTGKEHLLVGSLGGIYDITDEKRVIWFDRQVRGRVDENAIIPAFRLHVDPEFPEYLLVGDNGGLNIIEYHDGVWWYHKVEGIMNEVRSIAFDPDGSVWAGTYVNGIYHYSFQDGDTTLVHYTTDDGLPVMKENEIFSYGDGWRLATRQGIYRFNREKDVFEPDTSFPQPMHNGRYGVFRVKADRKNNYWVFLYQVTTEERIHKVMKISPSEDGQGWIVDSVLLARFDRWVDAIYPDRDSLVWFGRSDGLFSFDEKLAGKFPPERQYYAQPFHTLIRRVRVNQDSVVFYGSNFCVSETGERIVGPEQNEEFKYVFPFSLRNLDIDWVAPFFEEFEKIEYSYRLLGSRQSEWSAWSRVTSFPFYNMAPGHYTFQVKARNIYGNESEVASFAFVIQPPWYQTVVAFLGYIVLAVLVVTLIVRLNARRLVREKIRLEGIVAERTAEVVKQKEEITDSIHYASRIQQALLPSERILAEYFSEHFIYFLPRDIVSGDFYWISQKDEKIVVVAADCTGHGVPGAFMSMLGISFLNEIVNIFHVLEPDSILNQLRELVMSSLKQTGKENETKDGMDVAVLVFDKGKQTVKYAGAYNPLYMVRPLTAREKKKNPVQGNGFEKNKGDLKNDRYILKQIRAEKMPIGISAKEQKPFTCHTLTYQPGYSFYIFSDGYVDQFGGPEGKKFLSRNLKQLLLDIQDKRMDEQYRIIDRTFHEWKGPLDQVDDIIMIGIRG